MQPKYWITGTLFALAATAGGANAQSFFAETTAVFGGGIDRGPTGDIVRFGRAAYSSQHSRVVRLDAAFGLRSSLEIYPAGIYSNEIAAGEVDAQNGLVVAGNVQKTQSSNRQAWIAGYNETFGLLWDLTLTPDSASGGLFDVAVTPDGIFATGYVSSSQPDALIAKFDPPGVLAWQRVIDLGDAEFARDLAPTADGGVLVSGSTGYNPFVLRLDASGDVLWAQGFGVPGVQNSAPIVELPNGEIFVTTTVSLNLGLKHPWVARLDAQGSLLWQNEYPSQLNGPVQSLAVMPDGGVVLQGWRDSSSPRSSLTRIDASGAVAWQKLYTYGSTSSLYNGDVHADAVGRILLPWTRVSLAGTEYGHVAAVGADGDILNCSTISTDLACFVQSSAISMSPLAPIQLTVVTTTDDHHVFPVTLAATNALICGDPCSAPESFCTTSPNSVGSGALIASGGSTSVAANDFELHVYNAPPQQAGIFYYGPTPANTPLGDGTRCVGTPSFRLPVLFTDATGHGEHDLDMALPPHPAGQITAGSTWYFQFWYRDPQGGPVGFNLSDALAVTACP